MAAKSFEISTGNISYDASLYDKDKNKWVREISNNKSKVPTYLELKEVIRNLIPLIKIQNLDLLQ